MVGVFFVSGKPRDKCGQVLALKELPHPIMLSSLRREYCFSVRSLAIFQALDTGHLMLGLAPDGQTKVLQGLVMAYLQVQDL